MKKRERERKSFFIFLKAQKEVLNIYPFLLSAIFLSEVMEASLRLRIRQWHILYVQKLGFVNISILIFIINNDGLRVLSYWNKQSIFWGVIITLDLFCICTFRVILIDR